MLPWWIRSRTVLDGRKFFAILFAAFVLLAVGDELEPLQAQPAVTIDTTLDARFLNADDIGTAKETDMFVRVVGAAGAPVSGASIQFTSSDPSRITVSPLSGITSAQGSVVTHLAAQPRAARGPVTITTRVTIAGGTQVSKVDTVFIAGTLNRLVPVTSPLNLSGPGDRQKLVISLLDSSGQPSADGVPVAFSITTQNPLNVITFVEMPGPFTSVKSKEGRAEITIQGNQLGVATVRVQASTVQRDVSVVVGVVATPTPTATPSPTASPTVAPTVTTTPTVNPATGIWDPAPQAGVWALTYWQGNDAAIESAAQVSSEATVFWVLRNEGGTIRFLGYSKLTPEASDVFTIRRGEAAFAR